ncbi:MAG: hypothetical protein OXF41_14465 [bacterium]|nr:hypothetical protein [bacterium]
MDALPLPGLGLEARDQRSHIFGMLSSAWMAFDGRHKLSKYSSGEAMLFDLQEDPDERNNLITTPEYSDICRRLEAALTSEMMLSVSVAVHDRMPRPRSMAEDEDMGREGWTWRYPSPVDVTGDQAFYL